MRAAGRIGLKKSLWRVAYAKDSMFTAKLACEFILNEASTLKERTYITLTTGISILYARPFGTVNGGVGALPKKFQKFSDPLLQNTHDAILKGRDELLAHTDAGSKLHDKEGNEIDTLLKLDVAVGDVGADGRAEIRTQIRSVIVPLEIIKIYRRLIEDQLQRLQEEETHLLVLLYEGTGFLKRGVNPINIFDDS